MTNIRRYFMRSMIKVSVFVILVVCILLIPKELFGTTYEEEVLDVIRLGSFYAHPDLLVGQTFVTYFDDASWTYSRRGDQDLVRFSGTALYEGQTSRIEIVFLVNLKEETFETVAWRVAGRERSLDYLWPLLDEVFLSDPGINAVYIVKDGYFYDWPYPSVGEAFERFFHDFFWDYFYTEEGDLFVYFMGVAQYGEEPVEVYLEFFVDLDSETFEAYYMEIGESYASYRNYLEMMDRIFYHPKNIVREDSFSIFPEMLIGSSFDIYFDYSYWDFFISTDGLDIVECVGYLYIGDLEFEVVIQFYVEPLNEYFELLYWEMNGEQQGFAPFYLLLDSMHNKLSLLELQHK